MITFASTSIDQKKNIIPKIEAMQVIFICYLKEIKWKKARFFKMQPTYFLH